MAYLQGNVVRFVVRFKDAQTGIAVDPATVAFNYQTGTATPSTPISYASATVPALGVIARRGVGWYETWISVPSATTTGKWVSTGVGAATVLDTIPVAPLPF